jgi:protein arginine N-methyltransferase 1
MGDYLFEENMLDNLFDLKWRILKDSGKIMPARFQFFLEPVCLKAEYRVPFIWELDIHGIDYSFLRTSDVYKRFATGRMQRMESHSSDYFLCVPAPLIDFDLNAIRCSDDLPRSQTARKTVVRAGTLDGISIYFRALLDDGISFDTSLESPHTNWKQFVFRVPQREMREGDVVSLKFDAKEISDVSTWGIVVE